jgi:hypothetical protein
MGKQSGNLGFLFGLAGFVHRPWVRAFQSAFDLLVYGVKEILQFAGIGKNGECVGLV